MSDPQNDVIRPLESFEAFFEIGNTHGCVIPVYQLSLTCRTPLDPNNVKKALQLLYRKIPSFGLCIKETNNKLYFCRRSCSDIDFQVVHDKTAREISDQMTTTPINSTDGPLWKATLLMPAQENKDPEYLYKHEFFLSFHHSITDGFSSFNICQHFLNLLNDVIGDVPVSDEPYGEFANAKELVNMQLKKAEKVESNPILAKSVKEKSDYYADRSSLFHLIHPPNPTVVNKTIHLIRELDPEATAQLHHKFKSEKVTFHSGIFALVDWSIICLLQKHGITLPKGSELSSYHDLNMRRYFTEPKTFGSQAGSMRASMSIEEDFETNIWDHARKLNGFIKKSLEDMSFLSETYTLPLEKEPNTGKWKWPRSERAIYEYTTTNMRDVTPIFNGEGKHVQVPWMTRTCSIQDLDFCFAFVIQTFRGRFQFGGDFVTKFISLELAQELLDILFTKIEEICKSN